MLILKDNVYELYVTLYNALCFNKEKVGRQCLDVSLAVIIQNVIFSLNILELSSL